MSAPMLLALLAFPVIAADVPRAWDEAALANWAMPLAGLKARPTHLSPREYYELPIDNLRTYPVYLPAAEPPGYWDMLQKAGPQPLIEPAKLRSPKDWIEAGKAVFEQVDHVQLRTWSADWIAAVRRGESIIPGPGGRAMNLRWVPTSKGVALSFPNCANCHVALLPNGLVIPGAPTFAAPRPTTPGPNLVVEVQGALGYAMGGAPIRLPDDTPGMRLIRAFGVPWLASDEHESLKGLSNAQIGPMIGAVLRGGGTPRWNGSLLYPAKVPDLIGIRERKYIDHTATHLNRGTADLMRYAALVTTAESTRFGPHEVLGLRAERVGVRHSDEMLYALALYLESLTPPPNPHRRGKDSKAGEKIFHREGCARCHTPPFYTNNKLTPAEGMDPHGPWPPDAMRISVGTDNGLALKTRKGTGFYKVPSIKGVWYRGHLLHDGSLTSLEEMFDPHRLSESFVPTGFQPVGMNRRAVRGHTFGLGLSPLERGYLIAFLKTL